MDENKPLMGSGLGGSAAAETNIKTAEVADPPMENRLGFIVAVCVTISVIIAVITVVTVGWINKGEESEDPSLYLANAVFVDNIMNHLNALQDSVVNDSRSVMTGYVNSSNYIISSLNDYAGCKVEKQNFLTPIYTENSSPRLRVISPMNIEFQLDVDFSGLRYGGNGTWNIVNVTCPIPNYGCNASDFNIPPGCIALIQLSNDTNDCQLITKAMNAQNASASAVIIYNNENRKSLITSRVRGAGWFPGDPLVQIPVLAGTYSLGSMLKELNSSLVNVVTNTIIVITETFNVICETLEGDNNTVIVAGAHLDSVPEGPGLNDNGSGSSTLLEIVIQWYALGLQPINKIRFIWWGSEEVGLIGSRHYVKDLQTRPNEFKQIAMNLNFDMLASPNYYLGIHDGSTAVSAINGSIVITSMFIEYFCLMDFPYNKIPLRSGSDFVPFVEAGIPAGGLAAGSGGIKSEDERSTFGGFANAPYDPCYHLYCDTVSNINTDALGYLSGAAAYVIQKSAQKENLREFLNTPPPPTINCKN